MKDLLNIVVAIIAVALFVAVIENEQDKREVSDQVLAAICHKMSDTMDDLAEQIIGLQARVRTLEEYFEYLKGDTDDDNR